MLSLLSPEDYEDLPDDPKTRWIHIERLARKRLSEFSTGSKDPAKLKLAKLQYIKTITAAARAVKIEGIAVPGGTDPTSNLDSFMTDVEAAVASIMFTQPIDAGNFGIKIPDEPKDKIRRLVVEVQSAIPELKLSDRRAKRLNEALLNFLSELDTPRARFSVGSAQLLIALTMINMSVTTVGQGDEALENILQVQSIWGEEHERDEAHKLGIAYEAPLALIEAPRLQIEKTDPNE